MSELKSYNLFIVKNFICRVVFLDIILLVFQFFIFFVNDDKDFPQLEKQDSLLSSRNHSTNSSNITGPVIISKKENN